jgi:hypothetical protein
MLPARVIALLLGLGIIPGPIIIDAPSLEATTFSLPGPAKIVALVAPT